jgi:hypothetical protein
MHDATCIATEMNCESAAVGEKAETQCLIVGADAQRYAALGKLLGLLGASARYTESALDRMAGRVPKAILERTERALTVCRGSQAEHRRILAVIASNFGVIPTRPAARVRRFFVRLDRCDLRTHLSRVAVVHSYACQVLSRVLTAKHRYRVSSSWVAVLSVLRRDQKERARATRALVHMLSVDPIIDQYRARETRWRFARVLVDYDSALRALGVDIDGLH